MGGIFSGALRSALGAGGVSLGLATTGELFSILVSGWGKGLALAIGLTWTADWVSTTGFILGAPVVVFPILLTTVFFGFAAALVLAVFARGLALAEVLRRERLFALATFVGF